MDITCPNCQFSRQVPDDKIPSRSVNATCPQCGTKFRFRKPEEAIRPDDFSVTPPAAEQATPEAPEPPTEAAPETAPEAPADETQPADEAQSAPQPEEPAAPEAADPAQRPGGTGHYTSPEAPQAAPREQADDEPRRAAPRREASDSGNGSDIWQRLDDLGKSHPGRPQEHGSYRFSDAPEPDGEPVVPVPFEDLESFGFFGGLWETARRALFNPALFFEAMPLSANILRPMVFYVLMGELAYLFMAVWDSAGLDPFSMIAGKSPSANGDLGFYAALSGHFVMLFIMPLFLFAAVYVNAGIVHVLLKIFRAGDSGFKATFRVCCYANATGLFYLLPFVGMPVSFLWQAAVMVAGLRAVHRASYPMVVLAYLPIFVLGLAAFAAPFMAPAGTPPTTM